MAALFGILFYLLLIFIGIALIVNGYVVAGVLILLLVIVMIWLFIRFT